MKKSGVRAMQNVADAGKDAKREFVLLSAREEFLEKGLEGATMRGIALRSGCTTGAIYPLFDSKEAIYAALLAQSLAQLEAVVRAAIDRDAALRTQVRQGCRAFTEYYLANQFEVNLGLYAFRGLKRQGTGTRSDRALDRALANVLRHIEGPLSAIRGGDCVEARMLTAMVFSHMIGALVLDIAGRLDSLATNAHAMVELMLVQVIGYPRPRSQSRTRSRPVARRSKSAS